MRPLQQLILWLRKPADGLRGRILQSGIWATLLNISDRVLQIGKIIFLAQLLSPSAFGVVGLATLTVAIGQRVTNLGLEPALINHDSADIDSLLNTTWSVRLVQTAVLVIAMVAGAPLIAEFFDEPQLVPVLRVVAAGVFVEALRNPSIVYFRKDLEFQKEFVYTISGSLADVIVAVTVAVIYQTLWALVAGLIAGRAVRTGVSYRLHDDRPSLSFNRNHFRELFGFGKWIWATGVIVFIATTGDDTFVGWYLGAAALGLYQMAFRLSNAPATEVTHVISQVMFPAYSKLQHNREGLRKAFSRTIQLLFLVAVPLATGIYLVTPAFIIVGLGKEWAPVIVPMQIMSFAGLFRAISASGGALFQGSSFPEWDFRMNLVRSLVIIVSIWPLTDAFGISGAALSITAGIGLTVPIWLYKTQDITGLRLSQYLESAGIPLIATATMAPVVSHLIAPSVGSLIISIGAGAIVYTVSAYSLFRIRGKNIVDLATDVEW